MEMWSKGAFQSSFKAPSGERWKRYRGGTCPRSISRWLLRRGRAARVPTCHWGGRQVCATWGTGALENSVFVLARGRVQSLASSIFLLHEHPQTGRGAADAHFPLVLPRHSSVGAVGTHGSPEGTCSPSPFPHLTWVIPKDRIQGLSTLRWHGERGTSVTKPAPSPQASPNLQPRQPRSLDSAAAFQTSQQQPSAPLARLRRQEAPPRSGVNSTLTLYVRLPFLSSFLCYLTALS